MRNPCQFCFLCKCLCVSVGVGDGGGGRAYQCVRACVHACACVRARAPFKQNAAHTIVSHYKRQKRKKEKKKLDFSKGPDCHTLAPSRRDPRNTNTEEESRMALRDARAEILRGSFPDTANSLASGCCVRKRTTLIIYKARGATRPASSIWFCAAVLQCEVPILCAAPHCVIIGLSQR